MLRKVDEAKCFCEGRLGQYHNSSDAKEYVNHRKVDYLVLNTSDYFFRPVHVTDDVWGSHITSYAEPFFDLKCIYAKVFPGPIMNVYHCISIPLYWMCALDFRSFIMEICVNVSLV